MERGSEQSGRGSNSWNDVNAEAASSRLSRPTQLALHAALILGSLIMLAPFLIMLVVTLSPMRHLARRFPLNQITLNNFAEAFRVLPFGRYFLNSAIVTVTVTTLQILDLVAGREFAFARLRFTGHKPIFLLYLATLMIPVQVTLIPNFLIIKNLGWYNTYLALTVPALLSRR